MKTNGQLVNRVGSTVAGHAPCLSDQERAFLKQLDCKVQMVRDRTAAVVAGYTTGLYLFGEGGLGKSYTVLQELGRLKADYVLFNSRMTGRGLYNSLERLPSSVHVLEDMEPLLRDKGAQGVLRSALWAQRKEGKKGPLERLVTWTTFKMEHSFIFTGGIILIANRPLHDVPELRAVKTRIPVLHLEVTAHELRALMRSVALKGYEHEGVPMTPGECMEVCNFIIDQSVALRRSLDMRLLIGGFADYLQYQEVDSGCHWHDLVAARIRERPTAFEQEVRSGSRSARKAQEQEIVRRIVAQTKDRHERLRLWQEAVNKSEAALYRRIGELENN
jgi:hypothetical protein